MSAFRSSAGPAVCTSGTLELGGDDVRERGLAEPGRPGEQHVVEWLAAPLGRLDEDLELVGDLLLVDELREPRGPKRAVELVLAAGRADVGESIRLVDVDRVVAPRRVDPGVALDAHDAPRRRPRRVRRPAAISSSALSPSAPSRRLLRLVERVAEVHQALAGQAARVVVLDRAAHRDALAELAGDLLAQLDDQPLGGPLADPGAAWNRFASPGGDRLQQLARGPAARGSRSRPWARSPTPRSGAGRGRAPPRWRTRTAPASRRARRDGRAASPPCRSPAPSFSVSAETARR